MKKGKTNIRAGFTLIELLVVISIISILSSVVLGQLKLSQIKTRDTIRIQNIKTLQLALENYYSDNGAYPQTFPAGGILVQRGECIGNPTDYIPGLAPTYIKKLPSDPILDCDGITHSWFYASNGRDYKVMTHTEFQLPVFWSLMDPAWDGGVDDCLIDNAGSNHYAAWSSGGACWRI